MAETRDRDIRMALRGELEGRFCRDPDTRIIEELGICEGNVRIDLAVANCALHGYEIKSGADTLQRLPAQAEAYSKVFDYITLVTAERHLTSVERIVPRWWGITLARSTPEGVLLEPAHASSENPGVEAYVLAQLLWRDEALTLARECTETRGLASKPRAYLWRCLAETLDLVDLKQAVRNQLKVRTGWRADGLPSSGGDPSRSVST